MDITQYFDWSEDQLAELSSEQLEKIIDAADKAEKYYNIEQNSRKVLINSLYGCLGQNSFRYYDIRNARAVTSFGQLAILWIERKLNEYFNNILGTVDYPYVIYIDTDSVYLRLEKFVGKALARSGKTINDVTNDNIVNAIDSFAKGKVEPYVAESYQELAEYMNSYEQLMNMDREIIASCLVGETLVKTDCGEKRLDQIQVGDMVLSYNEETEEQEYKKVVNFIDQGVKMVYDLVLDDGRTIRGTSDHLIGCIRDEVFQWVPLIEIKETDTVL